MASVTAVELGADICALARTRVRRGEVQLLAAETLDPAAFPAIDAFTAAVRQARKSLKLPKRCRAVVWGLPDGANRKDPAVKPLIAPLAGAGFRVERVISPCNALAALARLRTSRGEGSTCWLAINRTGVAMVVVRPGKQLYSHSFTWDSNVGSSGSQARLLQRYSLVAFLTPEIRRAMAVAREKGTPVDAIITCGNLPEIRSLTMPLIEELDVEVEALDSLDGLVVKPDATDRLIDVAASLRIACAGAVARPTRRRDESKGPSTSRSVLRFAAAAVVIVGVLGIGWGWWVARPAGPSTSNSAPQAKPSQKSASPPSRQVPTSAPASAEQAKPAAQPITQSHAPLVAEARSGERGASSEERGAGTAERGAGSAERGASGGEPGARSGERGTSAPAVTAKPAAPSGQSPSTAPPRQTSSPQVSSGRPASSSPPASLSSKASSPPPTSSLSKLAPPAGANAAALSEAARRAAAIAPPLVPSGTTRTVPAASPGQPAVSVPAAATRGVLDTPAAPTDKTDAERARPAPAPGDARRPAATPAATPLPERLKDPVPRVTAILVSSDRRMATIDDGRIITVGDVLGKRVVVGIDERAVVLREPSGVQLRVGLGGRILGVERSER